MARVLVTGASGYIGSQIAVSLRSAGFKVYGLVRSEEKALALHKQEILPIIGDLDKPETYESILSDVSVVIDTAMDFSKEDPYSPNRKLLKALESSISTVVLERKRYIYTSGLLVYGGSEQPVTEGSPLLNTNPKMLGRISYEREVLASKEIAGVVVRPGFVYGGSGSFSASFFANDSSKESITILGDRNRRWSWVHNVDLADAYLRIAQAPVRSVQGEVFNIGGPSAPTWDELTRKIAAFSGFKGDIKYEAADPADWVCSFADFTVIVNPQKAANVLGWSARHLPLLDDLEAYAAAIKAHKN
eukprot:TRINITY_DN4937_c1_g1_i2.p1 TRINITY_DN4937_c1_g1~~TRINITY_DN4937_c1_g1_i2.p1  ORF type:complete len:303 (-),score=61.80 TRINITY_DN4937_c1_g1_i2:31-939(-)